MHTLRHYNKAYIHRHICLTIDFKYSLLIGDILMFAKTERGAIR